jgi:hypothetical protein
MVGDFVDFGYELCFVNLKRNQALLESNLPAIRLMLNDKKSWASPNSFILSDSSMA